jgi:DNA repair exonuclease SbcCD nuclease subunit
MIDFFKIHLNLIAVILVGVIGIYSSFKIYNLYTYYTGLEVKNKELTLALSNTKKDLNDAIKISNENKQILEDEREHFKVTIEEMTKLHEEELSKKEKFSTIKEKVKHEKDSSNIAPVLINTINRLFSKNS